MSGPYAIRSRVLVSLPAHNRFHSEAASGVLDYAEAETRWDVCFEDEQPSEREGAARGYTAYDGVIGCNWHAEQLGASGWDKRPLVVIGDEPGQYPRVITDNAAAGELAYRHLADRGFERFLLCGMPGLTFNEERWSSFRAAAMRDGRRSGAVVAYPGEIHPGMSADVEACRKLGRWLDAHAGPAGVFAITSLHAAEVVRVAQAGGRRVPEDLGVLGVGSVEWDTRLTTPSLSLVQEDPRACGFRAAEQLHRRMRGEVSRPLTLVPPLGVLVRASTGHDGAGDRTMADALAYIREHACACVRIDEVAAAVGLSRRALQRRFADDLGRTVHAEIVRVRVEAAQRLLRSTRLAVVDIAIQCGFGSRGGFNEAFKRQTGVAPTSWRDDTDEARAEPALVDTKR